MKKAWLFVCAALFLAATAFAGTPGAPLTEEALSAILSQTEVGGVCASPASEQLGAPRPILRSVCTAEAVCYDGSTRSCSGASTCTSVDNNCTWDLSARGYVTCDGVTTYCPLCPCNDTPICCRCERYGDCYSCCRCGGGTVGQCNSECYGY